MTTTFDFPCAMNPFDILEAQSSVTPGALYLTALTGRSWKLMPPDLARLRALIDEVTGAAAPAAFYVRTYDGCWYRGPGEGVTDDLAAAHVYTEAAYAANPWKGDGCKKVLVAEARAAEKASPAPVLRAFGNGAAGVTDPGKLAEAADLINRGLRFNDAAEGPEFWFGLRDRLRELGKPAEKKPEPKEPAPPAGPAFEVGDYVRLRDAPDCSLAQIVVRDPVGTPARVVALRGGGSVSRVYTGTALTADGEWALSREGQVEPWRPRPGDRVVLLDPHLATMPRGILLEDDGSKSMPYHVRDDADLSWWLEARYVAPVLEKKEGAAPGTAWCPVVGELVEITGADACGSTAYVGKRRRIAFDDHAPTYRFKVKVTASDCSWFALDALRTTDERPRVGELVEVTGYSAAGYDRRGQRGAVVADEVIGRWPIVVKGDGWKSWYAPADLKVIG